MTLIELNLIKSIVGNYLNYDFNNKRKEQKKNPRICRGSHDLLLSM